MPENEQEPMQRTPEGAERERLLGPDIGEGGMEIPIPTREQVYADLERVARSKKKRPPPKE